MIVEQSIAELKSAGLAHLPSGKFFANAAWLVLAVIAHNLGRGVEILAGGHLARATATTLRRCLFTIPDASCAPPDATAYDYPPPWPWQERFTTAMDRIAAIPAPT